MTRSGIFATVVLSVIVLGLSIWIGGFFVQKYQDDSFVAGISTDLFVNDSINAFTDLSDDEITISIEDVQDDVTSKPSNQDFSISPTNISHDNARVVDTMKITEKPKVIANVVVPTVPNVHASSGQTPKALKNDGVSKYWVQAGSFSTLARAKAAARALEELGLSGNIETAPYGETVLYRLRFGAWQSLTEAQRFRDYLRDQESLSRAFQSRQFFDRSSDFKDAYVVQSR